MSCVGLLGDDRDRLDRRRAGADHADALAGEVDALVRPAAGVVRRALEAVDAREVRRVRRRQAAGRHDAERAETSVAALGRDRPAPRRLVEGGRGDARVELDVAAQVEAVGDVVEVAQDLGLRRVALGPLPLLLELVGEPVGVLQALDVAARAGVAVPVPGAADAARRPRTPGRRARARAAGGACRGRRSRRRRRPRRRLVAGRFENRSLAPPVSAPSSWHTRRRPEPGLGPPVDAAQVGVLLAREVRAQEPHAGCPCAGGGSRRWPPRRGRRPLTSRRTAPPCPGASRRAGWPPWRE